MSIFSTSIIEEPWVGMAYKICGLTIPYIQDEIWLDAFDLNFSKTKLSNIVKSLNSRGDGTSRWTDDNQQEFLELLEYHNCKPSDLPRNYRFIIFICVLSPTLNQDKLSEVLTSCLKEVHIKKGRNVRVKVWDKVNEGKAYITIVVNTSIKQRIEIALEKR